MLVLDPSGSVTILKGEDIATTVGFGDWIAIVEVIALAGSWRWILDQNMSYSGWRRKASLAALACVSLAVLLDATNKGLLHLILSERVSGNHATELLAAMRPIIWTAATIACLSLILGLVGKGSPRLLALAWLCVLFFPNASILPSLTSELYGAWRGRAPIRSRLAALAGRGGVYC